MGADNRAMFYGARAEIFRKAVKLRENETEAEKLLWAHLSKKQLSGLKFRRQHPISEFIVDFYCHSKKLVIELDGEIHDQVDQKDYDAGRQHELENFGLKVLRFKNREVFDDLKLVLESIRKSVD